MIEFKQVSLKYPYEDYALFKDLTFTLTDGVNTVLCDSQSGKTSVCKLLTKEFAPTSGQILIDGKDIISITNPLLGILYLPSDPAFFERRSVKYNVEYPLKVRKISKSEREKRYLEVAKITELTNGEAKIKNLDLPERKRAALARGLTVERRIVLLDDFCGNVKQINGIIGLFGNATVVIITSNAALAQGNTIVLDGGYTVYCGDAEGAAICRRDLCWITDMM